jgi:hypothetical protein
MVDSFNSQKKFRLSPSTLSVKSDGEVVLFNTETGKFFRLEGAIVKSFSRLEEGVKPKELESMFVDVYEVDRQAAHADVDSILSSLEAARLGEFVEGNDD